MPALQANVLPGNVPAFALEGSVSLFLRRYESAIMRHQLRHRKEDVSHGHCQVNESSIQPLLPVAYSPHDVTSDDEPVQGQMHRMMTPPATLLYKRHRFPAEIISHCIWLYFRFSLSYRDVQEMMAERGVIMSHEAVRYWGRKFGQGYANELRRRRARPGDKWHLDEAFLTINSARSYLWRAVDQEDNVLDILVQSRRNKKAAKKFFKRLLKGLCSVPRVLITDKLKSYAAAKREVMPGVEHRQSRSLNNRCENSHRPTRERERRMQRFKSPGHAQRFLSAYGPIASHFRPVATSWQRRPTGRKCGNAARHGGRSPA
jgi:putative transposase